MREIRRLRTSWKLLTNLAFWTGYLTSSVCASETIANGESWTEWDSVKVAAAQVSIHTGTEGDEIVAFVDRAGCDAAHLVVLGEYALDIFPFFEWCRNHLLGQRACRARGGFHC